MPMTSDSVAAPRAPSQAALTPWDLFVLRHRHPGNLAVHFVSALMFFGTPIAAAATRNPWWLIGFFSSGMVGVFGHYAFKDSGVSLREATVATEVPYFVLVMFYKIARGSYRRDVDAALAKAARAGDAVVAF